MSAINDSTSGKCYYGGLIGYNVKGQIIRCSAAGIVTDQPSSTGSEASFGGLIGQSQSGTIRFCHFNGNITAMGTYEKSFVGGILGCNRDYRNSSISNCYASGEFSGENNIGGIIGYNHDGGAIRDCHTACSLQGENYVGGIAGFITGINIVKSSSTGAINGNQSIGGLVGYLSKGYIVESCAVGSVQANDSGGGLVGSVGFVDLYKVDYYKIEDSYSIVSVDVTSANAGGFAGRTMGGVIENCYAAGTVCGTASEMGGFIGNNSTAQLVSCFWDMETSDLTAGVGAGSSEGVTGHTTEMMQDPILFTSADWDFDNDDGDEATWELFDDSYPTFLWQQFSGSSFYSGGDGSLNDPYQIANVADFNEMTTTPADWSKNFILIDDIDLSGIIFNESPIAPDRDSGNSGFQGVPFTGNFNGNGHKINNLYIEAGNECHVGMFGKVTGAQIKNLKIENADISGSSHVGVVAGVSSYSIIADCCTTGTVNGNDHVAGLVGYSIRSTIDSCFCNCSIMASEAVGGLTAANGCGMITHSKMAGTITQFNLQGYGFVGAITACNAGDIEYSFSEADIIADGNDIITGGITAVNYTGDITSVYTTGAVTTQSNCIFSGGLIGCLISGSANYSYSATAVTANGTSGSLGGLVGENIAGPSGISSCVWDIESSGLTYSAGGKALNSQLMKSMIVFQNAGWADKGWIVNDGVDMPRLKWEGTAGEKIPVAQVPFAGSGTYNDPYRIYTAEEFALLSWYEGILDKNIILMNDLDLSGVSLCPIGDLGPFTGRFDGNKYILSNVTIHQPGSDYVGLVSTIAVRKWRDGGYIHCRPGIIINLKLMNADIIGNDYVGGLAGTSSTGYIDSCSYSGSVKATGSYAGGLVGCTDDSLSQYVDYRPYGVKNCYANASVSGVHCVGGLIGYNTNELTQCYSNGSVNSIDAPVGGLVGYNVDQEGLACFWDMQTSGQSNGVGEGSSINITGKTTAEMMTLSTFSDAGWDFFGESANGNADTWRMCTDGADYPHFRWEYTRRGDFVCGDGVDLADLQGLCEHWLIFDSNLGDDYDANGDGVIDFEDYAILSEHWLEEYGS